MKAYPGFLAAPPRAWCGPRYHQRWSPHWRPLEGPLSPTARGHAITVLEALFAFLANQRYLAVDPFAATPLPTLVRRPLGSGRTFTAQQWDWLEARLDRLPTDEPGRRLARALRWLYATGLRLGELTAARCGDLVLTEDAASAPAAHWALRVTGPGRRARAVPLPATLVAELEQELARHGRTGGVTAPGARDVAVLARLSVPGARPWTSSGAAKAIRGLSDKLASELTGSAAASLMKASAHWLRHSHATHALHGREGDTAPLSLAVVRHRLGHA